MRLLIVEDNARLAELVAEAMGRRGMACDVAPTLAFADDALACAAYDAVLLDLGLPDGDGRQWLQRQRVRGLDVPVLMLTARSALDDRIGGLDAGADDYLVKPAETEEIAARLRALLRRPGPRAHPVIEVGAVRFDTGSQRTTVNGTAIDLTRRETALLELLMRHAGSVVRRQQIENSLYGFDDEVSANAVDAIVSRLRRRLVEAGAPQILHTIRGLGYLFEERAA
ncbi:MULTISPECIES: winged helix-turn-helix domain-containing protein [Novosphingobium]|uniref:winged helix-turn-helix domain-containing protein n=1 Tax=Novosphingobium TaxID=165696 RepID=UPI001CD336A6|nr:response regulator transcription factor [Novosphingobium percolationis]